MRNKTLTITGLSILIITLIGTLILFVGNTTGDVINNPAELEKVKIGYRGHLFYLPAYVAEAEGYYRDQGLEVELIKFDSTNQLVEAVLNGNVNAGVGGVNSLVPLTIESKTPGLLRIFTLGYYSQEFDDLLVRKDSNIRTLQDLEGKTLSSLPGSTAITWMNIMLEEEGLTGKVNVVQTKPAQQLNALSSGSVDAIFVLEPLTSIGESKGVSRVLVESPITKYFMDGMLWETSVFSTEFVNGNPETAEKISNAIDDAIQFINSNQDKAKSYYSEFTSVEDSLEPKLSVPVYQTNSDMNIDEFRGLANKLKKEGLLEKDIPVDSMFYKR